jgi:predicted outer membrane repeat protein
LTGGGFQNGTGSPKLTSVTFNGNLAGDQGGGFFTFGGTPALSKVVFQGNTAVNYGGGMWSQGGPPTLTDVTFNHNQAVVYGGGGLFSQDTGVTLSRVTFSGNTAGWGGGMYNNGGSNSSLTNVTFNGNAVSVYGGAMFNQVNSNPTLKNVTISGNTGIGGAIYNDASHPSVISSIIWGNVGPEISNSSGGTFTISHSILKGGCPAADPSFSCGRQILNTNPKLGPLASNGGFTKTMALALGSPAIDSLACLAAAKTDQRGGARPQGPMCDMGAYERVP